MAGVKIRRGSVLLDLGLVRAIRPLWIAWLLLMPSVAQAQFTFTTNNGAITITGYTGPGGNVTIPDTTNGWPVATIGAYAFSNQTTVTSVTIPNSVTSIGSYAFSDCVNLHQAYFQGDAPTVNGGDGGLDSTVFQGESGMVYYMPGTTGWGATFGGWPTLVTQAVHETGYVSEKKWMDQFNRTGIENGTLGTPTFSCARPGFEAGLDNPGSWPHDSALQQVGYFIPPEDGNYVFFVTSHDDADLFLSTDSTAAHKQNIARESGWSNNWQWNGVGGGGSVVTQKRSDSFIPDGQTTPIYSNGIPLLGGHRYYMEVDHDTSRWGNEQVGVTYREMDVNGTVTAPADGSYPNCTATNVGMLAIRCTTINITTQPSTTSITVPAGGKVGLSVGGNSDSLYPIESAYGYTIVAPVNTLFAQWYKILGGVTNAIPGATGLKLIDGPLTSADNGAKYYCAVRALGYADDALNPIWTNSQTSAAITVVGANPPELIGHFISGAANLNDTANVVAPGMYYGVPARATNSTQFYYFTNDVPYGAPTGAVSLHLNNYAIAITNTSTTDSGYVVDTFDGSMKNAFTVMCWAKGNLGSWNTFVAKGGDNGVGWALRTGDAGGRACWTVRGSGGSEDMQGPYSYGDGQWHHYAGVYDSTATNITVTPASTNSPATTNVVVGMRSLYVDGVQVAQQTGQGAYTLNGAGHLTLGTEDLPPGNNYGFTGYITANLYDVRIYNYALTGTQIQDIFNPPIPITWGAIPSFVTTNNVTYADYPWYPSCGVTMVGMGPLTRNGNTFWYDFDLEIRYGVPCPLSYPTHPHFFITLGNLSTGVYSLITTSWEVPIMTNTFTVPTLVLQSAGFAGDGSFQLQLQNGITNANYVLQSSTNLLDWTSLSTNSLVPVLTDTNPVLSGPRYYRVQIFGQ